MEPPVIEQLAKQISDLQEAIRHVAQQLTEIQKSQRRDPNDPMYDPIGVGPDPYDPD